MRACRQWLDGELAAVRPAVLGTLGATAAKALLGSGFRITAERGRPRGWEGYQLVPTVHPSSILRESPEERDRALDELVADLRVVAGLRPGGRAGIGCQPVTATRCRAGSSGDEGGFSRGHR